MKETIIDGDIITSSVIKLEGIVDFNSIRIFDGDREVMQHDLKIVIYQTEEKIEE